MPRKKDPTVIPKKKPRKKSLRLTVNKIWKERKKNIKLSEKRAETLEQMKDFNELLHKEVKWIFNEDDNKNPDVSPNLNRTEVVSLKYNIPFSETSFPDILEACSQRFLTMSNEQNDLLTSIHYNHLINAGWSPELKDVQSVLHNWDINLDSFITKPFLKPNTNSYKQVGQHNFELVMNFIVQSIQKNNKFSNNDLFTLAKFAVAVSYDHPCKEMINVIKILYSTCIQTAFQEDNETDIIAYVQELFSKYEEVHLLKITHLFLPLEGEIMKKIYTYLTFKLYRSLLGKTECLIELPTNINEWFIQDLVDREYFIKNPKEKLINVVHLLEHIVIIFDLYEDEKKLSDMYDFLYSLIKSTGSVSSEELNILDIWKLQLFRKHVNHKLHSLKE